MVKGRNTCETKTEKHVKAHKEAQRVVRPSVLLPALFSTLSPHPHPLPIFFTHTHTLPTFNLTNDILPLDSFNHIFESVFSPSCFFSKMSGGAPATAPQPSLSDRVKTWWKSLELATQLLVSINVAVFIIVNSIGMSAWEYCFNPYLVVQLGQVYRVFTSPFLHGGLLHIAFNMMALSSYGPLLGREIGTFPMLYLVFLFIVVAGVMSTAVAYGAYYLGTMQFMMECGVGFSGVLFALIVVDNHVHQVPNRSIFGCFSVPAKYYPVALLAILQLIIPGISLLGHASGLIAGYLFVWGWLRWFVPLSSRFGYIEHLSCLNCVCTMGSFVYSSSGLDWYGSQDGVLGRQPRDDGSERVRDVESGVSVGGNSAQWTGVGRILGGRMASSSSSQVPTQSMPSTQMPAAREETMLDEKMEVRSQEIEEDDGIEEEDDDVDDIAALMQSSGAIHHHHPHDADMMMVDDDGAQEDDASDEDVPLLLHKDN
jgi:membrane associated rhomboid family serine protease